MKINNEKEQVNEVKWSKRSGTYDNQRFDYFRYMQKKLIAYINLTENTNFLDLGCGTGWAVYYTAEILKGQGNFAGVDIARGMIQKSKTKLSNQKNINFYQASSEALPFAGSYFDVIICTNSFHHYHNPQKALHEGFRVLKPRGRIYILDVTADDFFMKCIDRLVRRREREHVKFYSTGEFRYLFSQAGLQHLKSKRLIYPLKVHIAVKKYRLPSAP